MPYQPSEQILQKYASVLIDFALGGGRGVRPGETVVVQVPESAKPLYVPLRSAVLKAGGHPIMQYLAQDVRLAELFEQANESQLSFFPDRYYRGLVDQMDHLVRILAETDKRELQGVPPQRILLQQQALRSYMDWRNEKEAAGRFTWTLALYGTPQMAAEVGMSEQEYWEQIVAACYLDQADPIAAWRQTYAELEAIRGRLNSLAIDRLHLEAEGTDLWVGIGPHRQWLGGSGRNMPSFELFISPDWRRTEGEIRFNQPLYRFGSLIEGVWLRFSEGRVVEAQADSGQELLREMVAVENADKVGEFSLTDGRFSRITRTMGETLFDENIGGAEGNTHLALGNAYQDSFPGDPAMVRPEQWEEWGYNRSAIHTDIVSTERRTVTAHLADGSQLIIYKEGRFLL